MIKLDIQLVGVDEHFTRGWAKLAPILNSPKLHKVFFDWWFFWEQKVFMSEGSALNGRWKKLNPIYAAYKEANWGPRPILQRDYRLYNAMTDRSSDTYKRDYPKSMVIGIQGKPRVYWATHNFGDRRKAWGRVMATYPKRQFVGMKSTEFKALDERIRAFMKEIERQSQAEFAKSNATGKIVR